MRRRWAGWSWWIVGLVMLAGGVARALATEGVHDGGHFFSAEAIQRAERIIDDVHQRFGRQLLVETFATIPDDLKSGYVPGNKAQFFTTWTTRRAAEQRVNGLYILVCREPSYLELNSSIDMAGQFRGANQQEVREALLNSFGAQNYDQGLTDAAEYFRSTLGRNSAPAASEPVVEFNYTSRASSEWKGLGWVGILLIVVAVLFVLRLLLTVLGAGGGGYEGGGGFGRGFMGGLLGGFAGNWLYGQMFGRRRGMRGRGSTESGGKAGEPSDHVDVGGS